MSFYLGRAGQTCVWGFVVLLGKPALNRGKKEGRKGGGKARVSLFLDAISSPSSYPCQSVHCSGSVSE